LSAAGEEPLVFSRPVPRWSWVVYSLPFTGLLLIVLFITQVDPHTAFKTAEKLPFFPLSAIGGLFTVMPA